MARDHRLLLLSTFCLFDDVLSFCVFLVFIVRNNVSVKRLFCSTKHMHFIVFVPGNKLDDAALAILAPLIPPKLQKLDIAGEANMQVKCFQFLCLL
jgi:hypothetical protein